MGGTPFVNASLQMKQRRAFGGLPFLPGAHDSIPRALVIDVVGLRHSPLGSRTPLALKMAMPRTVVIPIPVVGFDPTEVAVPWRILTNSGYRCQFATPVGAAASSRASSSEDDASSPSTREGAATVGAASGVPCADPIMLTGQGLGLLKWSMRADANGIAAYRDLEASGDLSRSVPYASLVAADFDGLLLPGGHCPDMRPYLEDVTLHNFVRAFAATGKPVAAVCHGVVLAARSGILTSKRVTALPHWMESLAFNLTRLWMGNYYRTYSNTTVQAEVSAACGEFLAGPKSLTRDSMSNLDAGFTVRDGSLLTARWPGDAHQLGSEFVRLLNETIAAEPFEKT